MFVNDGGGLLDRLGWRGAIGRNRLLMHILFWLLAWPLGSLAGGIEWIHEQSIAAGAPILLLTAGSAMAAVRVAPELYFVGVLGLAVTFVAFSLLQLTGSTQRKRGWYAVEALAALSSFFAGVALVYPSVLRHPLMVPFHGLRVGTLTIAVCACAIVVMSATGWAVGRTRGAVAAAILSIVIGALGYALSANTPAWHATAGTNNIILLGLDSVSLADHPLSLQQFVSRHGGVWYPRAVSPGLLTNSVWTAILMDRPVPETGVFLTFQSANWGSHPDLVRSAASRGFTTVSWFTGQFSIFVGSEAGFDENRSGPKGWLEVGTSGVKDSSVLLPVVLRWLPQLPGSMTPRNQSGTFAYDLDTDLREILSVRRDRPAFVAAHVDYLHAPVYPSYGQLGPAQRRAIWNAKAETITDQSLNWQFPEIKGDPIGLYKWKVENLQRAVLEAFEVTRVVEPSRRNRVIVFSDHGDRTGLTPIGFGNPKYYNVIFATFGVPPRDPRLAISLLDIGWMVGLAPPVVHPPIVAYTNVYTPADMAAVQQTASIWVDGSVDMNPAIMASIGERLLCFDPRTREYWRCRAQPLGLRDRSQ